MRQITVETTKLNLTRKIGEGGQGQIFQDEIDFENEKLSVAVKKQLKISESEKEILQYLKGKQFEHIIKIIAFEDKGDEIFTIMELGESLNLQNQPNKKQICLQMAKGVSELHKQGFYHRDLKPDNFVVGKDNKIKLIDFGISKKIEDKTQSHDKGTYKFMAPEALVGTDYDLTIDIWSLGMVFYQIFVGFGFFYMMEEYEIPQELIQIQQMQIDAKIRAHKNLEQWQINLLQNMIIQRLDQDQKLNKNVKRIGIDQVIHQLQNIYEQKVDLYEVLEQLINFDDGIFNVIIQRLKKEKIYDCQNFLKKNQEYEKYSFIENILKNISELDFNQQNYSSDGFVQTKKELIKKISQEKHIIEFLKFLVNLTAIDETFIQCGSNSLNLLVEMKVDLSEQSFENIRIRDTSLVGGNFLRCNFNGSAFDNVDISGMNLNQAQLFNCKWKKIKIYELNKLDDHSSCVNSVCFSPDGTTLASGRYDKSIFLWDAKTGQQKAKLDGHQNSVNSVCFSPDGTTLASGSYDKSICLWDAKTGQYKAKIDGHQNSVNCVCFSPDGTTLASGSSDNSISLWNINTGQQNKLDGHSNWIASVCFSPDGTNLVSGSLDKSIRLWDVQTGKQKKRFNSHYWISTVSFSPDGTTLASGGYDKTISLWLVKTKEKKELEGHTSRVYQICFSPDGTTLASGSEDKSIRLWVVKTGQQKAKLNGHTNDVMSVCFSPDGTKLVSGSYQEIRFWEIETKLKKAKQNSHSDTVRSTYLSPDGTILAIGSQDRSIRLWDVKTGQYKAKLDGHQYLVNSVCFHPDGTTLASSSGGDKIRLWDLITVQQIFPQNYRYKDILAQYQLPLIKNNLLQENATILVISQNLIVEAQGALILQGELLNNFDVDLRQLFKSKGSLILEDLMKDQEQKKDLIK